MVGFLPGRVVLPEWLLDSSTSAREIVLVHEEEHVRAWDPALILIGLLSWVAMLWNVGLWLISRRLRRAVEVDCDLRVLARGVNPRIYSRLLVEVMERGTAHRLAVTALSESPSFLERRIYLMLSSTPRWWRIRAAGSFLLASGTVSAACQVDRPGQSPLPITGATYVVGEDGSLEKQNYPATIAAVDAPVTDVEMSDASPVVCPTPLRQSRCIRSVRPCGWRFRSSIPTC